MQRGIVRFVFAALLVISGVSLTAIESSAVTFSYTMTLDSVTSTDFTTNATYQYTLTQNPGSGTLSYIDFEIPSEIYLPAGPYAGATTYFSVTANGVLLGGEVYDIGIGDYGTKFGVGDARYRVVKANVSNPAASFKVILALKGQTFTSGRRFADAGQSESGAVLIKAGNGANTQTFVIKTPTVVNPPVTPHPFFSSLSVFPNPVVVPACTTVSWVLSDPSAVVTSDDPSVDVVGNQATVCPAAAGSYTYTITATGAGGSTSESFTITAVDAPPPPLVLSLSYFPNPLTPPGCMTVRWDRADATVTINPSGSATISSDPNDPAYATICFDLNVAPGTYTYQLTATVPGGSSSTVSFSVTVNPPPIIETTCKQIRKNLSNGSKTCVNLCLNLINGAQQDIASATWYNNGDCDPAQMPNGVGEALTIYGPNSPEKTLICNPCRVDVPASHPQACTANEDQSVMPFRYFQVGAAGNPWKHCDVFKFAVQDEDIGVVLGDDPWRYTKSGTMYWSAY